MARRRSTSGAGLSSAVDSRRRISRKLLPSDARDPHVAVTIGMIYEASVDDGVGKDFLSWILSHDDERLAGLSADQTVVSSISCRDALVESSFSADSQEYTCSLDGREKCL